MCKINKLTRRRRLQRVVERLSGQLLELELDLADERAARAVVTRPLVRALQVIIQS